MKQSSEKHALLSQQKTTIKVIEKGTWHKAL